MIHRTGSIARIASTSPLWGGGVHSISLQPSQVKEVRLRYVLLRGAPGGAPSGHQFMARVGEFEVATPGGIWAAVGGGISWDMGRQRQLGRG